MARRRKPNVKYRPNPRPGVMHLEVLGVLVEARELHDRLGRDIVRIGRGGDVGAIAWRVMETAAAYAGVSPASLPLVRLWAIIDRRSAEQVDDTVAATLALFDYGFAVGRPVAGTAIELWVNAIAAWRDRHTSTGRHRRPRGARGHCEALCDLARSLGLGPPSPVTLGEELSRWKKRLA